MCALKKFHKGVLKQLRVFKVLYFSLRQKFTYQLNLDISVVCVKRAQDTIKPLKTKTPKRMKRTIM